MQPAPLTYDAGGSDGSRAHQQPPGSPMPQRKVALQRAQRSVADSSPAIYSGFFMPRWLAT